MPGSRDTIAAIATASGEGGIAIVRVSGPLAQSALRGIFKGLPEQIESHKLYYGRVVDGDEAIDEAMAVLMRAPKSYTREDVAEIHCHGSVALTRKIIELLSRKGVRAARAGEFTQRAFLSGRIDMAQAEAVMDMIGATNACALREAVRQMDGGVSQFVRNARRSIIDLIAGVAAATDFPDEIDEDEATFMLKEGIERASEHLRSACDAKMGRVTREGLSVVLAGLPNAGKSSLMNALLEQERAIVTDIPGTTRDVLTEHVLIGDLQVNLTDTAGLRDAGDAVERIGVERARTAIAGADVLLIIIDSAQALSLQDIELLGMRDVVCMAVLNKSDLTPVVTASDIKAVAPSVQCINLCANTGEGVQGLCDALRACAPMQDGEGAMLTHERHIGAARKAVEALSDALEAIQAGFELDLVAIDLSRALEALGEITGETLTEDVISTVFSRFCVGK